MVQIVNLSKNKKSFNLQLNNLRFLLCVKIVLLIVSISNNANAVGNLSFDLDTRYVNTDFDHHEYAIEAVGMSFRKVFADNMGDRLIVFSQLESMNNFTHTDLHQFYLMYKGPLGKWNLTSGKLRLPYGLLPVYSSERMLFSTLEASTIGEENDNGVLLSGVINTFDYAISFTNGAGALTNFPNNGLLTARVALIYGDSDEWSIGLSGAFGKRSYSHDVHIEEKGTKIIALDFLVYLGRLETRSEISAGVQNTYFQTAFFSGIDFAWTSRLELNTAISFIREDNKLKNAWGFIGATYNTKWVILRGGYKHAYKPSNENLFYIQAYKLFSFNF